MKLKNIPNILSFIRLCLVAVFAILFFNENIHIGWALLVFLIAGATDVVDGFLARRYNWITNLGKILDPLADKAMQCMVLVCLCIGKYIPWWFAVPFFIKEICTLCIGVIVIKRRSVTVVSKWYGKLSVCMFYLTIAISILFYEYFRTNIVLWQIVHIPAAIIAVVSFIAYLRHYSFLKNEEIKKGNIIKGRKE